MLTVAGVGVLCPQPVLDSLPEEPVCCGCVWTCLATPRALVPALCVCVCVCVYEFVECVCVCRVSCLPLFACFVCLRFVWMSTRCLVCCYAPTQTSVPYPSSSTSFCSRNADCPGSYCQLTNSPVRLRGRVLFALGKRGLGARLCVRVCAFALASA